MLLWCKAARRYQQGLFSVFVAFRKLQKGIWHVVLVCGGLLLEPLVQNNINCVRTYAYRTLVHGYVGIPKPNNDRAGTKSAREDKCGQTRGLFESMPENRWDSRR